MHSRPLSWGFLFYGVTDAKYVSWWSFRTLIWGFFFNCKSNRRTDWCGVFVPSSGDSFYRDIFNFINIFANQFSSPYLGIFFSLSLNTTKTVTSCFRPLVWGFFLSGYIHGTGSRMLVFVSLSGLFSMLRQFGIKRTISYRPFLIHHHDFWCRQLFSVFAPI